MTTERGKLPEELDRWLDEFYRSHPQWTDSYKLGYHDGARAAFEHALEEVEWREGHMTRRTTRAEMLFLRAIVSRGNDD